MKYLSGLKVIILLKSGGNQRIHILKPSTGVDLWDLQKRVRPKKREREKKKKNKFIGRNAQTDTWKVIHLGLGQSESSDWRQGRVSKTRRVVVQLTKTV